MLKVWVEANVLNLLNLVVRVIDNLEVSGGREVKHLLDAVVACVELDQVLDVTKVLKSGQRVARYIDILEVLVTSNSL